MNHSNYLKKTVFLFVMLSLFISFRLIQTLHAQSGVITPLPSSTPWFSVQSVDTMKVSRDLAREKLSDPTFDTVIQQQVQNIKNVGATYVAVGTPYDEEFVPYLTRWVTAARKVGLHVWFRGNFSGWEGWFDYPSITRDQHLQKLEAFITAHPELFATGDIFTPCHECENGGPGDPRSTGDVAGFRAFTIAERNTAQAAFAKIHKDVYAGYFGTNGDVASLIMDQDTTSQLGGVVTVDHYVQSDADMARDVQAYETQANAKVMIGEFGSPIPDINGDQTPEEQAAWLDKTLHVLATNPGVVGVNYWAATDSSTELWNADGSPRPAVAVLEKYYKPKTAAVSITDDVAEPLANAHVSTTLQSKTTDGKGNAIIPVLDQSTIATVSASGYLDQTIILTANQPTQEVILQVAQETLIGKLRRFFFHYFHWF